MRFFALSRRMGSVVMIFDDEGSILMNFNGLKGMSEAGSWREGEREEALFECTHTSSSQKQ